MLLCEVPCRLVLIGFLINSVSTIEKDNDPTTYEELTKEIQIMRDNIVRGPHHRQGRQDEDEDSGGILGLGDLEVPSVVPQFFKVVGQVLAFNRSEVADSVLQIIPPGLGSRLTNVLGDWANNYLGTPVIPTTTKFPPPKRRRRTTTASTAEPDNSTATSELEASVSSSTTPEPTTEPSTETPTTTETVLFKAGSLGELPVYASAYAPNYVPTTNYPVYAGGFLHALHSAPTTPKPTTTTPSTTTDPNSYNVELPFDYLEPSTPSSKEVVNLYIGGGDASNGTAPGGPGTPPEYEEYEDEDVTEESQTATPRDSRSDSETTSVTPSLILIPSQNDSSLLLAPASVPPSNTTTSVKGGNTTSLLADPEVMKIANFVNQDVMKYRLFKEIFYLLNAIYRH